MFFVIALKGHAFRRAKKLPSGAKAQYGKGAYGTAEAVPFQNPRPLNALVSKHIRDKFVRC